MSKITTPTTISGVTILNKSTLIDNESANSNRFLKDGEIAVLKETSNGTWRPCGLLVGVGEHFKVQDLIDNDYYIHLSEGAGYKLPKASYDTLGGITLHEAYWYNYEGQVIPKFFTYSGPIDGYWVASFSEKTKVKADWIEVERIDCETVQNISTNERFISVNKDHGSTNYAYITCTDEGQISIIGTTGEVKSVWPLNESNINDYAIELNTGTNRTILRSEQFVIGTTYGITVDYETTLTGTALGSGERAGIRFYNWDAANTSKYAELSVNNQGTLYFSKDGISYSQVGAVPSSTGVVWSDGATLSTKKVPKANIESLATLKFVYPNGSSSAPYNPLSSDQTITMTKIKSSSLTVSAEDSSSPHLYTIEHPTAPSISYLGGENGYYVGRKENGTSEIFVKDSYTTDNYGHINGYYEAKIDFSYLIERVATNETNITSHESRIGSLETKIDSLATTATVESLTNRVTTTETEINILSNDIASIEDAHASLEKRVNDNVEGIAEINNQISSLQTKYDDLAAKYETLLVRVEALESQTE